MLVLLVHSQDTPHPLDIVVRAGALSTPAAIQHVREFRVVRRSAAKLVPVQEDVAVGPLWRRWRLVLRGHRVLQRRGDEVRLQLRVHRRVVPVVHVGCLRWRRRRLLQHRVTELAEYPRVAASPGVRDPDIYYRGANVEQLVDP